MRALILEDDPVSRLLLARVLESRGHEVISVGTRAEAFQHQEQSPFDLMVVDILLPDGDGLEFARKVRAGPGGEDVYILVVTGLDSPHDLDEVLEARADDYLAKPVDPRLLTTRIAIAERSWRHLVVRRRVAKALKEREALLAAIFDAAPDGILACDAQGRVLSANPTAATMLNTAVDDLIGAPLDTFVDWQDTPPPWRADENAERVMRVPEVEVRPNGGSSFPAEAALSVVPLENESIVTIILRDVSQRHALEARLRLTDRMSTVGTLAAGIAHEINNPLTYVIANLDHARDVLLNGVTDGQLPDLLASIQEAHEGAERVRHIVRDLRTFSRPDEEATGPVDVITVLESSVSMVQNEIRPRARLERDYQDRRAVLANAARLGQVFLNILVNAAHAIPEGDAERNVIRVRTRSADDGGLVVEIVDTGRGIPPDARARIFDPFFTTKPVGEGTGLGLFICHSIVRGLGGSIDVTSDVGVGTTLSVKLPVADAFDAVSHTPPPEAEAPTTRRTILVLDDEGFVGRAVQRALKDHDVVIETDPRDALPRILAAEFDLVLCDLLMPELSGMDVWDAVQRERPELGARLVFMTGGAFTPRAQDFLAAHDVVCLEKPFVPAHLRKVVRKALDAAQGTPVVERPVA